jgi:hypothetical protein
MSTLVKSGRTTKQTQSIKQTQATSQRRLFLEGLERRAVLAGDVWAAQFGGNLMIHGDAEDNGVHLHTMADGTVEVSGMDAGGSPTLINGSDEPFVASNVRFLTRVHLGNGDDRLQIDAEASGDTDVETDTAADVSADASATIVSRLRGLVNGGIGAGMNGSAGFQARQHLLINTGNGHDTVDATVDADVDVHLAGNLRGDSISIETMTAESDSSDDTANTTADANLDAELGADLSIGADANVSTDADVNLDPDADVDVDLAGDASVDLDSVAAALETEVNAGIDAAGQLTAGGIGLNTDLDTALTADLALNSALNSASNLGASSLLNTDQNLNGSIGGAAALNLAGDQLFDEIGLFNGSSLANMDVDLAAQLALANANNFGLNANNVDDFFADLNGQNSTNTNANANVDAGLLATLGNNDIAANGSLNTNVNASLNNAYQSRLGVPLG